MWLDLVRGPDFQRMTKGTPRDEVGLSEEKKTKPKPKLRPHCLGKNILLNVEFKNEATKANLQENKSILKWRPFWNKVYFVYYINMLMTTLLTIFTEDFRTLSKDFVRFSESCPRTKQTFPSISRNFPKIAEDN